MKPLISFTVLACSILYFGAVAPAQTYRVIKNFGILTNMTGLYPKGPLIQGTDGTLYGTTASSEIGHGSVFKIQPDGTGFTVLKWFTNSVEGTNPVALCRSRVSA